MQRVSRLTKTSLLCRVCKTDKGADAFQPAEWKKHAKLAKCRECYRAEYGTRALVDARFLGLSPPRPSEKGIQCRSNGEYAALYEDRSR